MPLTPAPQHTTLHTSTLWPLQTNQPNQLPQHQPSTSHTPTATDLTHSKSYCRLSSVTRGSTGSEEVDAMGILANRSYSCGTEVQHGSTLGQHQYINITVGIVHFSCWLGGVIVLAGRWARGGRVVGGACTCAAGDTRQLSRWIAWYGAKPCAHATQRAGAM